MKIIWGFSKHLKIDLPNDSASPFLGIHLKVSGTTDPCTSMLTVALLTRATPWKHSRCPTIEEWIKEMSSCIHVMGF